MNIAYILLIAFIIDLIIGDPLNFPHPIRFIGKFVSFCEGKIRKFTGQSASFQRLGGLLLLLVVVLCSFFVSLVILIICYKISVVFGTIVQIIFCYQILAVKSLATAALAVYKSLKKGDLAEAREKLSEIVGRDTENLDEKKIIKATIESVAENTCDGVIAPIFFMVIGGAPLGFLYKATNTLDSMVGYKNKKYINFGYFSAKFDDILNFIPARITGVLYIIAAYVLGYNGVGASRVFFRDRLKHASPNSGHSEAAVAGALDISLGGGALYSGKFVEKPIIGDDIVGPCVEDIFHSVKMFYFTSILGVIIMCVIRIVIVGILGLI